MEHKILVVYVGVAGIRSEDIDSFVHKIVAKVIPSTFEGEIIVMPTQSPDTRIECINPKYITDEELIAEHTKLMNELQFELQNQLNTLRNNRNEQE